MTSAGTSAPLTLDPVSSWTVLILICAIVGLIVYLLMIAFVPGAPRDVADPDAEGENDADSIA